MGIRVDWDSQDKAIITYSFEGYWTWPHMHEAVRQVYALMATVNYTVDVIVDLTESSFVPSEAIANARQLAVSVKPHTNYSGTTVYVGMNTLARTLLNAVSQIYYQMNQYHNFVFVRNLAEAYKVIEDQRKKEGRVHTTVNKVGVIGWPVTHSISPAMHNAAFRVLGLLDWSYELAPVPPDIVRQSLKMLREEGGFIGVNVTVPLKQAVMPFVQPDERARAVGAVNVIDFRTNLGTNTDVVGFIDDLKAHNVPLKDKTVIVLGAGGAARAAVYGLVGEGAEVVVVNRTPEKAQVMLADLTISAGIRGADVKTIDEAAEISPSLIVNCTSVGMWPKVDESPWIDGVPFPKGVTVYDMVYRPLRTRFMEQAEAVEGRAIGGLGMLVRQGAAAFNIWAKHEAPVEVMYEAAENALRSQ
ncbi:MAG: shikimate dehydrogenase [Anaerolineae bacterium]|nr:shikimate dehydrogenase [Anaerolineae bacterium]